MSSTNLQSHAILFADIVGSTRLYETVGDLTAKQLITDLENEIAAVVTATGGQLVEIIGDEVMARFDDADTAAGGACRIQERVENYASRKGMDMSVRIGLHFGPAIFEQGRMFGDSVNIAARVAGIAQGRQIIMTEQVVQSLSAGRKRMARRFDEARVKGKQQPLVIYDLLWHRDSVTCLQAVAFATGEIAQELRLVYRGEIRLLAPDLGSFSIGRSSDNGLVVAAEPVSRIHAKIEYSRGKFVLTDTSTNGTYVMTQDGQVLYLRREALPLSGRGQIGLGEPISEDNRHLLRYESR